MPGLTDRDLRRIERFVWTPPTRRTPDILVPTDAADSTDLTDAGRTNGSWDRGPAARTGEGDRTGTDDPPSPGRDPSDSPPRRRFVASRATLADVQSPVLALDVFGFARLV